MSIILIFVFYKLIEALINSGAFTDSSEEEKMKKLGFATGSEVRKNAFTEYHLLQIIIIVTLHLNFAFYFNPIHLGRSYGGGFQKDP